jgi:3-dehydroquinate synthase
MRILTRLSTSERILRGIFIWRWVILYENGYGRQGVDQRKVFVWSAVVQKSLSLTVNLGERSYPINSSVYPESFSYQLKELIDSGRRVVVVTDDNLIKAQASFFEQIIGDVPRYVIPAGEQSKSLECLSALYSFFAREALDRKGVIIAIGGGVVGDLVGFAAASFLRGIDFFQVPTTLLAMVDSSVGGKTGINLPEGKNLAGAFHQPNAVFIITDVLKTLPARDFAAGTAEVLKYGLLADEKLFSELSGLNGLAASDECLPEIIYRCCEIKAGVVKEDEKETAAIGGRALLNLGHTFAHAIENVAGYGEYLHGEAVGIGLVAAARLSSRLGYLSDDEVSLIEKVVSTYQLPVKLKESLNIETLIGAMKKDKKVSQGAIRFVVLESIGKAITLEDVEITQIEGVLSSLGAV